MKSRLNIIKIKFISTRNSAREIFIRYRNFLLLLIACGTLGFHSGCKSPFKHRSEADKVASEIIRDKQKQALGEIHPGNAYATVH